MKIKLTFKKKEEEIKGEKWASLFFIILGILFILAYFLHRDGGAILFAGVYIGAGILIFSRRKKSADTLIFKDVNSFEIIKEDNRLEK